MPRAETDAVTAPFVGFARCPEGVEPVRVRRGRCAEGVISGSSAGPRARLIFTFTVPEAAAGDEHLRLAPCCRASRWTPGP
nr:hypothetical protein [Streptomyces xantholiticus]